MTDERDPKAGRDAADGREPGREAADARTSGDYWSFRGYRLTASEFNAAMAHFYRGEIGRSTTWRQRLDATTNWAVVTAGALLTFSLGDESKPHFVIPLGTLLILMFLFIEARRYQYYELFTARVRLMETDFFGAMLMPPFVPSQDWAEALTSSLLNPQFPVSLAEAVGRRLRQNYMVIFVILALTWLFKISSFPSPATSWHDFVQRATVGVLPGWFVLGLGVLFNVGLVVLAVATTGLHEATGEVLPRYTLKNGGLAAQLSEMVGRSLTLPWTRQRQHLVYIISEKWEAVGRLILDDMDRGVTLVSAKGLYTGQDRPFLMCAMAPTELPHVKHIVASVDPQAFVIVVGAQEIHGKGFHPLDPR